MHIETLILGQLDTNCYLAWCETTLEAIVIDPADSGDVISQLILSEQLDLRAIVLTHGHFDHILGLLELKLNFPEAPILMHHNDLFLVDSVQRRAQHWLGRAVDPAPPPDRFVAEGQVIAFGDHTLTVLETPGHTPGSISLYDHRVVFTGDTLFKQAVGRTDFSYSNSRQLWKSIERLQTLPGKTKVYPGHGPATTLNAEYAEG